MNPGKLRQKIEFLRLSRVSDGAAGHTATDVPVFSTLAEVKALKSLQTIEAGKMILVQPYQVLIRQAKDHVPTLDMKVKYKSGTFLIKGIEPADELNKMLKLVIARE